LVEAPRFGNQKGIGRIAV